jgi:hypothetical protein
MPAAARKFNASPEDLAVSQRAFCFLIPVKKNLLTTGEVARFIGRNEDYVRQLLDEGRMEYHADSAFGTRVTRRSVLYYLLKTAQYEPDGFLSWLADLAESLTPEQRTSLASICHKLNAL